MQTVDKNKGPLGSTGPESSNQTLNNDIGAFNYKTFAGPVSAERLSLAMRVYNALPADNSCVSAVRITNQLVDVKLIEVEAALVVLAQHQMIYRFSESAITFAARRRV